MISRRSCEVALGLWICRLARILIASMSAFSVHAADYSISGYGTLGVARSDKSYSYQRFIDDAGTFRRDSVGGLQIDASLNNQFGATAQVRVAPASDNDSKYKATVAWAFASYRPTNDWLIRIGRQRIPLYLYSQNYDVAATYDFARLPTEMYSISPGNEFDGISVGRVWSIASGDFALDGYWGETKVDARFWLRDGIPTIQSAGAVFRQIHLKGAGVVGSYRANENVYRLGLHKTVGRRSDGVSLPALYPFVSLFPGVGYYQVDPSVPGPGIPSVDSIENTIAAVGIELGLSQGYRVIAELARTYVDTRNVQIANASNRGYVSLIKGIDRWTPYVTYAFLRSDLGQRKLYASVNGNTVPIIVPGAALINASQRAGADGALTFDQRSLAIGTSYSLSATSKIKAELMRVRIGQVSSFVDAPPGSNIRNQSINVISLSYSVVF